MSDTEYYGILVNPIRNTRGFAKNYQTKFSMTFKQTYNPHYFSVDAGQ